MFDKLEIFLMASGLARHATSRQNVIAQNVANADTPGFKARDIKSFSDTYRNGGANLTMRSTRADHMRIQGGQIGSLQSFETDDPISPNGNSVSLETEMVKASEVRHEHELALSIYSKSMDILRASLGSR